MSTYNSQVETFGIPWRRLENDSSTYDSASGFLLLSTLEWTDAQQMLLKESLTKVRSRSCRQSGYSCAARNHLSLDQVIMHTNLAVI